MLDPTRPYAYLSEREPYRDVHGQTRPVDINTVFLTASRCPIGCSMCDLHLNTLAGATPVGAIVEQIQFAQHRLPPADWIKLYNSGNFFDPVSIPPLDYADIAAECQKYERVVIENHPRFGRKRHLEFRDQLQGQLEIAVGLETVQPRILERLGKQMTRDDFDRYADFLMESEIDLRVFLIVGAPGLSIQESIRWARLSIRHATRCGARHISLIPARSGHGWNGQSDRLPTVTLQQLSDLYASSIAELRSQCCLSVDLWDIKRDSLNDSERSLLDSFESAILRQAGFDL